MKNVFKKSTAVLLSVAAMVSVMSGCGDNDSKDGVKELSLYMASTLTSYSPELPVWKAAEAKTGIRLINTVSNSVTDENSAFATMLLSKELPDIVRSTNANLRNMAKDGGLMPLDEYIDEYAPNLKAFFEACPLARDIATMEDGHIYFVPGTTTDLDKPETPSSGFFIRKDWLEKLGLEEPKTIDQLHDVLLAFKTQDPNGNGLADEVPYFSREKKLDGLFNLFCTGRYYRQNDDGSTIFYAPADENFKEAIKVISKWYAEGLIDSEIFTRNQAREQLLGQNLGGCTSDWFSSTGAFNDTYAETVPGLNFAPMLPPANINGEITWPETRGTLHGTGWGISKDCSKDDIIDAVKYLDFWMSTEGCELMAYGVEGISYTKDADGNITWTPEALSYADGLVGYRRSIGFIETGTVGIMEAEKAGMNKTALAGYELYENIVKSKDAGTLNYTDEEQEIYDKNNSNVHTYMQEQMQKWVMGKGDVEAEWDTYLATLKTMGYEEIEKVSKAAYERKLNNMK